QADRVLYKCAIRELLEAEPSLTLLQQNVDGLLLDGTRARGVVTQTGIEIAARTVVLTVGTFLDGKIHVGEVSYSGGRAGDPASRTARATRSSSSPRGSRRSRSTRTGSRPRCRSTCSSISCARSRASSART